MESGSAELVARLTENLKLRKKKRKEEKEASVGFEEISRQWGPRSHLTCLESPDFLWWPVRWHRPAPVRQSQSQGHVPGHVRQSRDS